MVFPWSVEATAASPRSPIAAVADGTLHGTPAEIVLGLVCVGLVALAIQDDEDPIAQLTRKVRRAAAGEDVDFDVGREDRLGELSAAIGDLAAAGEGGDLETGERYRREFYEITVDPDLTDREKIDRVLELGCGRFDVECGLITAIDTDSGRYEVETVAGSDFVTPGTVSDVSETFCRKTIEAGDVVTIYDAVAEGYGEDPGHGEWDIGCYLGAKLLVGDELYGTLCFVNQEPRGHPFTADEKIFADLLSRWVSHVLERREHVDALRLVNRSIEAAPIGITIADAREPDDPIVRVNPAFEEITGYAAEEVLGRNCRFLQGEGTDRERVADIRRAIDERETIALEVRNYRKDGTPFWNRVSIAPVRENGDDVTHFIGFQEDVTERKERQQEFERYRDFTDDILESIDDVFYVTDEDGTFRRWNGSFSDLTGYDDPEIADMHALEFFPEDHWPVIAEAIQDVFETGVGWVEAPVRRKDGDTVEYEFVANVLEDPDGEPVLVGIGRDITERKRYQAELERTTDMLQQAGRLAKFGGWELDLTTDPPGMTWTDELYDIHEVPRDTELDLETAIEYYHPEDRDHIRGRLEYAIETGRGYDLNIRGLTADGDIRWVRAIGEPVVENEEVTKIRGAIQDVTEQKEREFALETLHGSTRGLLEAETATEAADIVVEAATDALDLTGVGLFLYDEVDNRLEPAATSTGFADLASGELEPVGPRDDSLLWHAFATDSHTVIDGAEDEDGTGPVGGAVDDGLVIPIGAHGVFLAVAGTGAIDADTRRLVETLVASAEAGLDRIQSETELLERDAELEARNDRLRRQVRINETIRSVDRTLVGATNQADLETAVCEELAGGDDVAFAWIGGFDDAGDSVVARAWAGDSGGYLDSDVFSRTASTPEPAVAAATDDEPTLVENVARNVQREPWRREALAANFQSVLAVPLTLEEYSYGVLAVYATEPRTFGDLERTVFAELGESIANAITTVSTKQALYADTLVSLRLHLSESMDPLSGIAYEVDCRVVLEGLATHSGDETRLFVRLQGTDDDPEEVAELLATRHAVVGCRLVRESEEGDVYEVTLRSPSVVTKLVRHGGHPRSIVVTSDGLDVEVDVPMGTDVRAFVDMLAEDFDVELLGRREVSRSLQTRYGVIETILDELTKRQHEVLRTAYLAGFFNWPRDTTGEELATMLDVSQPTVNRHLRLAEGTIMEQLFAEDPSGE